jgi:surface polysaccharide O-acyltransferase-like enzyme
LTDRLIRLGIPVLVYSTLIINLNQLLLGVWLRGRPFRWILDYEPGHLWFLQALLLFALVYVIYRAWADRDMGKPHLHLFQDRFPPNRIMALSIIVLSVMTFIVRLRYRVGDWVFPGFQLAHFVHYIFAFFVGILAYRGDWFNRLGRDQARRWGIVALAMLPLFFVVGIAGGALEGDAALARFLGGPQWQSIAYIIWESILFIAALTFLLYFFREHVADTGPQARSMAASVYTVYIIHQTIVIALNVLFIPVGIPTILKFVIVSLIAIPLCFGLATLVRRIPYAARVVG